ncbi:flagellar motor stator protein MotA [Alphaproteobacteria bacterium]|nr:flagellar motor stator protein MotA [Alphaproteobacteria bacterium]
MFAIIGLITVIASIIVGYAWNGGHFAVLWQPGEYLIIVGSGFGAFLLGNPKQISMPALKSIPLIFRGPRYHKKDYLDLFAICYLLFKLGKTKGDMALEPHIEKPAESAIFQQYPAIMKDHEAMDFITAYLRMLTLGVRNANEVETIMDAEIDGIAHEKAMYGSALVTMGDSFPALGIVAAVLGVIHTMGAITEPPEVLGHLVGAALVGTFCGILVSYGFVGPIGTAVTAALAGDAEYLRTIKTALLGHMQGYAPQISVEFARKACPPDCRPSFNEVDEMCSKLSLPA